MKRRETPACIIERDGMDRRLLFGFAEIAALAVLLATPAAADPTLLCRRPEILQEVARTVRRWDIYNTIDEPSATEAPTASTNAVVCHVVVNSIAYAPTAAGWEPRPASALLRFDVQITGNRFVVQFPR